MFYLFIYSFIFFCSSNWGLLGVWSQVTPWTVPRSVSGLPQRDRQPSLSQSHLHPIWNHHLTKYACVWTVVESWGIQGTHASNSANHLIIIFFHLLPLELITADQLLAVASTFYFTIALNRFSCLPLSFLSGTSIFSIFYPIHSYSAHIQTISALPLKLCFQTAQPDLSL